MIWLNNIKTNLNLSFSYVNIFFPFYSLVFGTKTILIKIVLFFKLNTKLIKSEIIHNRGHCAGYKDFM